MKRAVVAALALALSSAAVAQTPPANPAPETPAVRNPNTDKPAEPAKGANSFTEEQVRGRLMGRGYSDVSGLKKDQDGIWRGKAMKGGSSHDVAVDYQGNVFPQ